MSDTFAVSRTRKCCGGPITPWCYRVRCRACGAFVTKHDHSREDAMLAAAPHAEQCWGSAA